MQPQDQVSTLKDQLDKKDKIINISLEKLVKKNHEDIFPLRATTNGSSLIQTSSIIQATSPTTQHDNMPDNTNKNKNSSINYKPAAQNIAQVVANADVPATSKKSQKTSPIWTLNRILSVESQLIRTNQMEILNLKENYS